MLRTTLMMGCSALVLASAATLAGIPEPPLILYGTVHIDGVRVHEGEDVTVSAVVVRDQTEYGVGQYRMRNLADPAHGDNPNAGDNYALQIRLESLADGTDPSGDKAHVGERVYVRVVRAGNNALDAIELEVTAAHRGVIDKRNLRVGIPDTDGDTDADLADFALFQRCFTGTDGEPIGAECEAGDLDADSMIQLGDHSRFVSGMTGPS